MKTVIFDLDGTILDTLEDLKNAVNHALNFYNYPEKDLEFVRKAIGNGTQVLIRRCAPSNISEEMYQKVFALFKKHYLDHYADYTRPYAGIKDLLEALKGKCLIVVVSNKDNDLTQKLINKEFPNLFDVIQGSYLDKPKKPDPYLINKIMKENNVLEKDFHFHRQRYFDYFVFGVFARLFILFCRLFHFFFSFHLFELLQIFNHMGIKLVFDFLFCSSFGFKHHW